MTDTPIQILASRFPYNVDIVESAVKLCDGNLNAAEWLLELVVTMGGRFPVEMTKDIQTLLVAAAKFATKDNPRGNTW